MTGIHTMKNQLGRMHRLGIAGFVCSAILTLSSCAYAGEPIPGVGVGVGKNPGGRIITVKTDGHGRFAFAPADSGSYTITFPYDDKFFPFVVEFAKGFTVLVDGKGVEKPGSIIIHGRERVTVIAQPHTIAISGTIYTQGSGPGQK
jgi:hypothetical protein